MISSKYNVMNFANLCRKHHKYRVCVGGGVTGHWGCILKIVIRNV